MHCLYTYTHQGYPMHIDLDQLEAIECFPNTEPTLKEADVRLTFKSSARTTLAFDYKSGAQRFSDDLKAAWDAAKQRTENREP